jgi:hypothetical protein
MRTTVSKVSEDVSESLLTPVLLYQPLRRQPQQQDVQPSRTTISTLLLPFLSVIRQVAGVSELVSLLVSQGMHRVVVLTAVPRGGQSNGPSWLHRAPI